MKKTRFLSIILTISMIVTLLCSTNAYASVLINEEVSEFEEINAKSAILVDYRTNAVLYEKNADEKRFPASTTKIMTALLVLEAIDEGRMSLDQVITADDCILDDITSDSSTQHITPGEEMTVEDLLYCLLVASANEAGNALAVAVSGSVPAFVEKMNYRASELGCTGTHYCNPHGLHSEDHFTTARDLYVITSTAWQYETFRTIVGTVTHNIEATNKYEARTFYNTNMLLSEKRGTGYVYKYAVGVKTGTTSAAGNCLVSAAEYDGRTLIAVVLGASDTVDSTGNQIKTSFIESRRLLRHGFVDFEPLVVLSTEELVAQVKVSNGDNTDHVVVIPRKDIVIDLASGVTKDDFDRRLDLPESVDAPIKAGDVIGTLTVSYQGTDYASVDLIAVGDVEVSTVRQVRNSINEFFNLPFIQLLLILIVVILASMFMIGLRSQRQRRRRRGSRVNRNSGSRRTR